MLLISLRLRIGFFSGPLIPLPSSIFRVVCPTSKLLGARLGMAQLVSAAVQLIEPPIADALVDVRSSSNRIVSRLHYLGAQLWCGMFMKVGTFMVLSLWVILMEKRHTKIMI